jgi:hypothetical protein
MVAGSSPARGAKLFKHFGRKPRVLSWASRRSVCAEYVQIGRRRRGGRQGILRLSRLRSRRGVPLTGLLPASDEIKAVGGNVLQGPVGVDQTIGALRERVAQLRFDAVT